MIKRRRNRHTFYHLLKANSDGTKDAEISGNNANDIQDAIKAINEQINAPFERRQGGFREGGGGGRYNDDREGGFYQGQRNNYSRGSGERGSGERGSGERGSGDRYNDRSGFRRDEN